MTEQTINELEDIIYSKIKVPEKYSLEYYGDMLRFVRKAIKLTIKELNKEKSLGGKE